MAETSISTMMASRILSLRFLNLRPTTSDASIETTLMIE